MASQVQIVNQALTKLGAARVVDIGDDTNNARTMRAIYDIKRDAELADQMWTFAIKRALIPASSTAPAFGWARAFPLPTDCLRVVQVGEQFCFYDQGEDGEALFQVETDPDTGRSAILTDQASPLALRYISRVTNPGLYPPLFVESFACRLAAESCEQLTQNLSKREAAWAERREAIRAARRVNAIEQPPQRQPATSWVRAMLEE